MELAERKFKDALKALRSLEGAGFQARLAGGCVRDRLLGGEPADFDVATTARPEAVMRHFAAMGLRTVPTGLAHGTVTLVMPSGPVEITTLRLDVATDGRHAQVEFGDSFEADAARRDFTINAMFEDARGTVYDYHGGEADLAAKNLRFVGDAAARIREDYLRIMRLFRFWARFGFTPAPGTLAAVAAERDGLARISQERITGELLRLLAADHAATAMDGMVSTGVWPMVVPEFAGMELPAGPGLPSAALLMAWRRVVPQRRGIAVLGGLVLRMQSMGAAETQRFAARLRLSGAEGKALAVFPEMRSRLLGAPLSETADALELVDLCEAAAGAGAFGDFYTPVLATEPALAGPLATVAAAEVRAGHLRTAKLPLTGDLVARHCGIVPGPELGRLMATLLRSFRNGEWHTPEAGLAWAFGRQSRP